MGLDRVVLAPTFGAHRGEVLESLESREVLVGTRVKVREGYNKPNLRGMVGAVQQSWSKPAYPHTALLVRFEDGWYELFWNHEVEKVEEAIKV